MSLSMFKSWLPDTDGQNTELRPDRDPIRNMDSDVDISQNLTDVPDGGRILDRSETSAGFANLDTAIAGAPTVARTPCPRQHATYETVLRFCATLTARVSNLSHR